MELQHSSTSDGPGWPSARVPAEVFWVIASYLPDRKDVGAMRLVNREFNTKVIGYFMKQLVISFGPEQSMKFAKDAGLSSMSSAFDMAESVMKTYLFRSFASHIQHLGLALKLGESELASPDVHDFEEIEIRNGKAYRRFVSPVKPRTQPETPLEKVLTALENFQGVFRLLSAATNVQELALSCAGGLGYLQGPDVNPLQPPGRLPIFSKQNAVQMTEDTSIQIMYDKPYKLEVMERKLAAAGIEPADIQGKIAKLLEFEGMTLKELTYERRARAPLPLSRFQGKVTRPRAFNHKFRLQPDQLTVSQMWYINQHLTAENALVQSFILTMLDNSTAFTNLTKLNLARIPSFHLDSLCRDDFWDSLPQVKDVALGVIPDWRSVQPEGPYVMSARQVYPTDAIPKVFELLEKYIGKRPNIERLHFEWHCGGELAAGLAHRDCHILPAPFIKQHRMVIDSRQENLLILPYITHLSLKNCWFAPNVFYRVMDAMSEHGLESLELETVSLSGPPILRDTMRDADPNVFQVDVPANHGNSGEPAYSIRAGHFLSWSAILDALAPVQTISDAIYNLINPSSNFRIKKGYKIQRLVFKSCGYVTVPDERFISSRRFDHPRRSRDESGADLRPLLQKNEKKLRAMEQFLQVSTDRHLAQIAHLIDPAEEAAMKRVYGFQTGWDGVYDEATINAAKRDGALFPGLGRYSGTIERVPDVVAEDDDEQLDYKIFTLPFEQGYDDTVGLNILLGNLERSYMYLHHG
ncbi:uncharacterized protein F4807DRAFT_470544 [Annulohypoxylon truncatum]|uniref:uncharacterized protein n=1 Tax=Annulohypoxylon truncatum TaxID=327061 RepID=UPI002007B1E7|nr:uncharacterized protein F4807DRAFT_470544 [Annulohypoxylon truncatum]KAI1205949.1 hypothetical protein F4807DRAFT_470544 [Annulohypoxylon truncatum]